MIAVNTVRKQLAKIAASIALKAKLPHDCKICKGIHWIANNLELPAFEVTAVTAQFALLEVGETFLVFPYDSNLCLLSIGEKLSANTVSPAYFEAHYEYHNGKKIALPLSKVPLWLRLPLIASL